MRLGRTTVYSSNSQATRLVMQSELDGNEKLVWAGRPISLKHHAFPGIYRSFFGLFFLSFAVFWTWGASAPLRQGWTPGQDRILWLFPLFGIPFVLVGLSLVLSPVWRMLKARRVHYAIADRRLIIRNEFPTHKVSSWPITGVDKLVRQGPAEGPGNVMFASEISKNSRGGKVERIGFLGID